MDFLLLFSEVADLYCYYTFPLRKYKLPMTRIIPFPKKGEPSGAPDYPPGKHVLAVYPGTTALYKATVVNHRKVTISCWELLFYKGNK